MTTISGLSTSNTDLFRASQSSKGQGGISVDGNRISWADDGHYEVQSATSYNTMSEGGTSGTFPHGTYNVINHTTGERFENVQVPSSENARFADANSKDSSEIVSTSQQNSQTGSGERSDQDKPLFTVTIPALTVNNELHLNNGVVIDIEELTAESITDVAIEVRPEDGTDDTGFTQGVAGSGLVSLGAFFTTGLVSVGLSALGVLTTVIGGATAWLDFSAKPTNPQTGHNSPQKPDNEFQPTGSATSPTHLSAPSGSGMGPDGATTTPDVEPELEPETPPAPSRPSGNQNTDNESNSHGGNSSHSSGGLSSGTGNQTSNNPHTA